jgi:DNA (cytosine-5)-methyltransferase 1
VRGKDHSEHPPAPRSDHPGGNGPSPVAPPGCKLKVLDLFSGIGGFSLGLERTGGFETVAFCEIEDFPRRVLAKHWPDVPCYRDVRELTAERLAADGIAVDVITGGFPCQDISVAGNQAGITDGTRSGLWSEIIRLACDLRPKFIIVENVSNLLAGPSERPGGWFGRVLADLAECGYDAEWENIPASALGAPHRRERVWLIAYPDQDGCEFGILTQDRIRPVESALIWEPFRAASFAVRVPELAAICGTDDGLPEELGAYGNAVVPQIPEMIGNAILGILAEQREAA